MNKFGFVILNYKTYTDTIELLYSLKDQVWFEQIQIYVVENGSYNESIEKLRQIQKKINFNLIISKVNLGFANGNNLGISKAREDGCNFIICSNSDIKIDKQDLLLKILVEKYNEDNNIAVIAPNIVNLDGAYQNPFRKDGFSKKEIIKMKLFYMTGFYKIYFFIRIYIVYNLITYLAQKRKDSRAFNQQTNGYK
ncbi:MAG: glycosyltransferase [Sulfurospirillum sp.]